MKALIDRLMFPLVRHWDRLHGYPRQWDNRYWDSFCNRLGSWLHG